MFSTLRTRFGIPGVISVIALVFAMLGGAYAAQSNSGQGKATASAKGKRGPRGPKGATGPAGAVGPQGPAGPAGANGKDGANGSNGAAGATGPTGPTGVTGATGPTGQSGFTETLPPGKTETGTLSARTNSPQTVSVPISFPIPLEPAPTLVYVGQEEISTDCPGIVNGLPQAEPGKLCVYASSPFETSFIDGTHYIEVAAEPGVRGSESGAGPAGVNLTFECKEIVCLIAGAWAATAE